MRVVVDTNVIVSALFKTTSVPALALRLVHRYDTLLESMETEAELRLVLARPKIASFLTSDVVAWIDQMLATAELVSVDDRFSACRDERDDKFLHLAVAGHADIIISGDADLLSMALFREVPIISPANFVSARRPR